MRGYSYLACLVYCVLLIQSQATLSQGKVSLSRYLQSLDSVTDKKFYAKKEWIDSIFVDGQIDDDYLGRIESAISEKGLRLFLLEEKYVFIYPNPIEFERYNSIQGAFAAIDPNQIIRIGDPNNFDENKEYSLSGTVLDETNSFLAGANIQLNKGKVVQTDKNGRYEVALLPGNYEMTFSYVGKELEERFVSFYSTGILDVALFPDTRLLDEVIVEGDFFEQDRGQAKVGVQKISAAKLEKLPSFLGNVDVVKSATALPGVTVSSESSAYLNVRGGTNDQTLILMNNSTIYNPGHLLGFFSVFNGDFISEMTLYKGNIPPKYGVRASSVLDVKMDQWADKKLNVYGGLGIADSNLGIKTKLLDDKLDVHIGGRISYVGWLFNFFPDKELLRSSARFGDVNFNSRFLLDDKNSFFTSGYYGEDYFRYADQIIYRWRTLNGGVRWSHLFNESWVLQNEIQASSLWNSSEGLEFNDEFILENGIDEISLKSSITNDFLEAGIDISQYSIEIGKIKPTASNSLVEAQQLDKELLRSVGIYASYLFKIIDGLEIKPGIRFNNYTNLGPGTDFIYSNNAAYDPLNIIGEEEISSGDTHSSSNVFEPRIGANYRWNQHTIRAGYSRINQFLHLISNTALVNPVSIWKGSDRYINPTTIDQYSMGYQFDFEKYGLTLSVDGFYKHMSNLLDYKDGATLVLNDNLEQATLSGKGESYGFEFLLTKNSGWFTGLLSYTYSRTFIKANDPEQGVSVNNGERYPYYSDRPHSVKASIDFKATKKWTISSNFTYISGAPTTAPVAVYQLEGIDIPFFMQRNSERIPDYHRMDLVITLKNRVRRTKKNSDRWVLTFYNLYGRRNVANIYFSNQNDVPAQSFKLINVGTIVPTLTYKFEF